jgi:nicotinamidase-related amidase
VTLELADLAAPEHTAIVTQECQGAVMGPNAGLAVLARQARREALPNIVRLLPAARAAGVRVVHCLVQRRPDGLGANRNARIFEGSRTDVDIAEGSEGAALLPELGPEPTDMVLRRWHGVGPMGGTDLDAILRNLGVTTIVAVGVSLNIAIPNLVMDAVNAAYQIWQRWSCRPAASGGAQITASQATRPKSRKPPNREQQTPYALLRVAGLFRTSDRGEG